VTARDEVEEIGRRLAVVLTSWIQSWP